MAFFNWLPQMPFTDLHQLNLDWLISKYKQLEDDEATIQESLEGAEAAKEDAEAAATDAANSATAAAGSATAAAGSAEDAAETAESISDSLDQIALNTRRIDNLVANAGDTDNNAELLDVRVGFTGHTYSTAGDAVRVQADHASMYATYNLIEHDGYITTAGTFSAPSSTTQEKYTDMYNVNAGDVVSLSQNFTQPRGTWVAVGTYSANGWTQRVVINNQTSTENVLATYQVPEGITGIRISYRTYGESVNSFHIYGPRPSNADLDSLIQKSRYGLDNPLFIPNGAKVAAHRGAMTEAPENTVPAFEIAARNGAWAIETDIYNTTDGVIVCFHDGTVDRMTDGTGNIANMTYAQVQALTIDAGSNIANYPNLKIPTLTEYLEICKQYGCVPIIEIKNISANSIVTVKNLVKDMGLEQSVIYISAGLNVINNWRAAGVVNLFGYVRDIGYDLDAGLEEITAIENCTIDIQVPHTELSTDVVTEAVSKYHNAGIPFMIWNIGSQETAIKYARMGVDIITSSYWQSLT